MSKQILTDRQLNRATLARQLLLERSDMGLVAAIDHLIGMQGQVSEGPYQGLWTRLNGFRHAALTDLIVARQLVRATSLRATLHLHTPDDLLGLRPLVQPVLDRMWHSAFSKRFGGSDQKAVHRAGVKLLNGGPMTGGALGKALAERFTESEPLSMSVLLQVKEILVQIPPTRIWGSGHAPLLSRVENWLPPPHKRSLTRADLVRRYLKAYGPASVNDMQSWSGLTRLGEEFEALGGALIRFEAADGRELFDLPEAPRPDPETPAPVRFLPLYDNLYLGYDDRRRVHAAAGAKQVNMLAEYKPGVLVDGFISCSWAIDGKKGAVALEVEPYRKLSRRDIAALEKEGLAFLRFMRPEASAFDVRVGAAATD